MKKTNITEKQNLSYLNIAICPSLEPKKIYSKAIRLIMRIFP